jgi:tRNA-splicing ligase RtcB (3'-phosphate/5'-hydroxy nucleic acid ligase)
MAVKVERIDACRWRIPKTGAMRTEGLVFASEALMRVLEKEQALEQVRNVATLPGIVGPSIAMPDIHWGYGFPIGGVAAFDPDEDGVVSPGGVGYDINCGVRLLRSALSAEEIRPQLGRLADRLYHNVPAGVGSQRRDLKLSVHEERKVLQQGARWAVEHGFGSEVDLRHIEEGGVIAGADPELVSDRALERGRAQLGTSAAATTSSRCRRSRRSAMPRPPRPSGSSPAR